jgi:hypothetical protein
MFGENKNKGNKCPRNCRHTGNRLLVQHTGNRLLVVVTGNQNPRDAPLSEKSIPRVLITKNLHQ